MKKKEKILKILSMSVKTVSSKVRVNDILEDLVGWESITNYIRY